VPEGVIPGQGSRTIYASEENLQALIALLNSRLARRLIEAFSPTLNVESSSVLRIPVPGSVIDTSHVQRAVEIAMADWSSVETSREFASLPFLAPGLVSHWVRAIHDWAAEATRELTEIDAINDQRVAAAFGLEVEMASSPEQSHSTLHLDPRDDGFTRARVLDLLSYGVGCILGRFSLDTSGLILGHQEATLQDYLTIVPSPTFEPDADNVIPIVDGDWFEDDIVERFRQFLRAAFGDEHFEENLRFVTETLGVKNLRDYFVKSFYKDHVQRYKKRPIYWLFSSPNGSFNALIYMHRYTPSTVSTVLNEYLREFQAKLKASLEHAERSNHAKEADRLRKILLELDGYEHDVLYPLASQNIAIDLDDGVKVNYPKFGAALKKIPGLEASE
jgi:hypothetical protein